MGIFNFFKKKDNSKLQEWQNIILGSEYQLKYSEKELKNLTNEQVVRRLEIITDCVNLVNTTNTVDVFFKRFDLLIHHLNYLSNLEKFIEFPKTFIPSHELNTILKKKDVSINDFIVRSWENILSKNEKFKTDTTKRKHIIKYFDELSQYITEFGPKSLSHFNKLKENIYLESNTHSINSLDKHTKNYINSSDKSIANNEENSNSLSKFENKNNWNISISFGKSSSSNYERAIFLAKESPNYSENGQDKNIVHQATYSSSVNDYLAFIKLYQLIGNWRSCFVFINGELTDKKIVGKLNYCYGDKCRSGNCKFCYGASEYTQNPFGCHRLQISAYNHPWWSFGILDTKNIWHVDKKAILDRINQNYIPFKNCPSFSYERVLYVLDKLPETIDYRKDKNWCIMDGVIYPKNINLSNILNSTDNLFKI